MRDLAAWGRARRDSVWSSASVWHGVAAARCLSVSGVGARNASRRAHLRLDGLRATSPDDYQNMFSEAAHILPGVVACDHSGLLSSVLSAVEACDVGRIVEEMPPPGSEPGDGPSPRSHACPASMPSVIRAMTPASRPALHASTPPQSPAFASAASSLQRAPVLGHLEMAAASQGPMHTGCGSWPSAGHGALRRPRVRCIQGAGLGALRHPRARCPLCAGHGALRRPR